MLNLSHKTLSAVVAAFVLTAGAATAAPVALTWTDTVLQIEGADIPLTVGEVITTTITVDNGGASVLSQSWSGADFVSYRVDGASGWWAQSTTINSFSGNFTTDLAGLVTAAGNWNSGTTAPMDTSWAGVTTGAWWNNGGNQIACERAVTNCVWATDVADNQIGASWTASVVSANVPLPAAMPLLLVALGGLAVSGRRRKAA